MRHMPESDSDREELARLNAAPWMVEALALNPSYCSWGPHEDYMWTRGDKESGDGWNGEKFFDSWQDFGWKLNDLNECVNFYFSIERDSEKCAACGESGYNPATREIADAFEARAKRLGVYGECSACDGHGYVYTTPAARLALTLWWLHPRKGASRGVEIKSIARDDLPAVATFLRHAADRNAERFAKVAALLRPASLVEAP